MRSKFEDGEVVNLLIKEQFTTREKNESTDLNIIKTKFLGMDCLKNGSVP